jgi:hypothetical protein
MWSCHKGNPSLDFSLSHPCMAGVNPAARQGTSSSSALPVGESGKAQALASPSLLLAHL